MDNSPAYINRKLATELVTLQEFIARVESSPDINLSHEQIDDYFQKMVLIASIPEGYESLCWKVGVWLLLLAEDKQNSYFDSYGYSAISAALSNTIANGSLPNGLGWYTSGFVPNDVDGDIMLNVLSHPVVESDLKRSLTTHEFAVKLDSLNPTDQRLSNASVKFLANLHRFGMGRSTQLMWTARLVQHLTPENPAREAGRRLVLEGLITTERYINAFYWLQAYFLGNVDDDFQDQIFEVIIEIAKVALSLNKRGQKILARMSYDDKLLQLTYFSKRARLYLGFVMLWLLIEKGILVNHDFIDQSTDLLWEYYDLALFVKKLVNWASEIVQQVSNVKASNSVFDYLNAQNQRDIALSELQEQFLHLPNYRGRGLLVELWKECRDEIFAPLTSALKDTDDIVKLKILEEKIGNLDPDTLIRDSRTYGSRGNASRRIAANTRRMLTSDFEEYIEKLAALVGVCRRRNVLRMFIEQIESEIEWGNIYREYDKLVEDWPSLEEYMEIYFLPIVNALTEAR